jgi:hypothetical protein
LGSGAVAKWQRKNNFTAAVVAHALLRAASSLNSTLPRARGSERRQECRRGKQECLRHICPPRNVKLFVRHP